MDGLDYDRSSTRDRVAIVRVSRQVRWEIASELIRSFDRS